MYQSGGHAVLLCSPGATASVMRQSGCGLRARLCHQRVTALRRPAMTQDIHIIGGGLAGSEAAWQLAEAGVRVRLSEMRGCGDMTPAHHTDGLAELVCSNSFRSDDAENNAVGLLHAEMRALGSLIMGEADATRFPPAPRLRSTATAFPQASPRGSRRIPMSRSCANGRRPARRGPTIVATGPLTAARSPARSAPRPAATRSPSSMRSRRSCIATASTWTSAGASRAGTRARRKDYINCPLTKDQYLAFHPGPDRRREDRVQGVGEGHALFRGLHADRGDGRARARDAALRADEAGRARRSAHRALALCRRPAAPGQCAAARCGTSSASRPS